MHRTSTAFVVRAGILAGVLGLCVGVEGGSTFYVDGTCGNDGWSGLSPVCQGPDGPKRLIGFAVNAAQPGDEIVVADGVYGHFGFEDLITVRSANGPDNCILEHSMYFYETHDAVLQGFTITGVNSASYGAIWGINSSATIADCVISNNSALIAGAIFWEDGDLVLRNCEVVGNVAEVAVGGVFAYGGTTQVIDCRFTNNASPSIGALAMGTPGFVANSIFVGNEGGFVGGGAVVAWDATVPVVNCVFSRNTANSGGGLVVQTGPVDSCSFAGNSADGLFHEGAPFTGTVANSVFWGNAPSQLDSFYGQSIVVGYSDVEGGWPGEGNIDADPLFANPGIDDLHILAGSPCLDAGKNDLLPPDTADLDGDGDTTEPLPIDLDGNPRVDNGVVDMGAYEGESEAQDASASEIDLDPFEFAILVPDGGELDPVEETAIVVQNVTGDENSFFSVTQILWDLHSGAQGFTEQAAILSTETSMTDGQFLNVAFIPIDAESLRGVDPTTIDLTRYDPSTGDWVLAPAGNTVDSPGHAGPVGDRFVEVSTGEWALSGDMGDYGVFWNPDLEQGFVWARLDYSGDFAAGFPICDADCFPAGGDGSVNVLDLLATLAAWGTSGACDVNQDTLIGASDLAAVTVAWGAMCAWPAQAPQGHRPSPSRPRNPDLNRDGRVDRRDLVFLQESWGVSNGRADLDRDGHVGTRDLLELLANWSRDH